MAQYFVPYACQTIRAEERETRKTARDGAEAATILT
jgi:hypothetical protein